MVACEPWSNSVILAGRRQIAFSVDDGVTWSFARVSEEYPRFKGLLLDDDKRQVIAIGDKHWWRSSDHGATWNPQPSPTSSQLIVSAQHSTTAFAFGNGGATDESHDGGATFGAVDTGPGSLNPLAGIGVPNSKIVVVAGEGGQIWRTSDSGVTWTSTRGTQNGRPIRALKDQRLGAIGRDAADGALYCAGTDGLILRSEDDGTTWRTIALGNPRVMASLRSIAVDEASGWIVIVGDAMSVIRSHDHGKSWDVNSLTSGRVLSGVESSLDGASVVAVGNNGAIVVSHDGGDTWHIAPSPTTLGLNEVVRGAGTGTFVAVGDRGTVLRSIDRGESWKSGTFPDPNVDLKQMYSLRHGRVLAALTEKTAIFLSTDDGANWHPIEIRADFLGKYGYVSKVTEAPWNGDLFIAVQNGDLLRSHEGHAWARVWPVDHSAEPEDFARSLGDFAVNAVGQTLITVSRDSHIYRSSDSGDTWVTAEVKYHSKKWTIGSVTADPASTNFSGSPGQGGGGGAFYSEDGGQTWHYYMSVKAPEYGGFESNGMLLGYVGSALNTSYDGGRTWSTVYPPLSDWNPRADIAQPFNAAIAIPRPTREARLVAVGRGISVLDAGPAIPQIAAIQFKETLVGKVVVDLELDDPNRLCGAKCVTFFGRSDADFRENEREREIEDVVKQDPKRLSIWHGEFDPKTELSATKGEPLHVRVTITANNFASSKEIVVPYGVNRDTRYAILAAALAIGALVACYIFSPLLLLVIARRFTVLEGLAVGWPWSKPVVDIIRVLGLFPWMSTLPRVLNAWTVSNRDAFQRRFMIDAIQPWLDSNGLTAGDKSKPISSKALYFPLPIEMRDTGRTIERPTADDFKAEFRGKRILFCVLGDGGVGKSSFALEVCRWASEGHLAPYPMQPIWIDEDTANAGTLLSKRIREIVGDDLLSEHFIDALLNKKRLLIVVDRISERNESTQKAWGADLPANIGALLITSRLQSQIRNDSVLIGELGPLTSGRLLSFLEFQIQLYAGSNAFQRFEERGDLAKRLSDLIEDSKREVKEDIMESSTTPLLTRLFVQAALQRIASSPGALLTDVLPTSIPEVYFSYLSGLNPTNQNARNFISEELMYRVCRIIAVAELGGEFRPQFANIIEIRRALQTSGLPFGDEGKTDPIQRLIDNQVLRKETYLGSPRVRFVLDPVAEYVAALELAEQCGVRLESWKSLLLGLNGVSVTKDPTGFRTALWTTYKAAWRRLGWPELSAVDFERKPAGVGPNA